MSKDIINKLEELDRILLEDIPVDELTDCEREQAHYSVEYLIDIIKKIRGINVVL